MTGLQPLARRHQCSCADDDFVFDYRAVHDGTAHADQYAAADGAAVQQGFVANGDVVTQNQRPAAGVEVAGVGDVQYGAVLDAAAVADADFVHVAADDGHGPDGAVFAHLDVSDHHRTLVYPGPLAKLWCGTLVSSYICHYIYLLTGLELRGRSLWEEGFPKTAPAAPLRGPARNHRLRSLSCRMKLRFISARLSPWGASAPPSTAPQLNGNASTQSLP